MLLRHARLHRVSFDAALSRRFPSATAARHAAWRELYDEHAWGFSRIARSFGCHHTTVMQALERRPTGGCPVCGENFNSTSEAPMTFVAGVATQRAYQHTGRVCITQTAWVLRGESEAA